MLKKEKAVSVDKGGAGGEERGQRAEMESENRRKKKREGN